MKLFAIALSQGCRYPARVDVHSSKGRNTIVQCAMLNNLRRAAERYDHEQQDLKRLFESAH